MILLAADDPVFSQRLPARFELRLYERYYLRAVGQCRGERGKYLCKGDEGKVAAGKLRFFAKEILGQVAHVHALAVFHSFVGDKALVELPVTHIYRPHHRRSLFEQHLREPARGSPDVRALLPFGAYREHLKGAQQLVGTPPDVVPARRNDHLVPLGDVGGRF